MRKWYSTFNHPENMYFIIEHEEPAGYYVFAYTVPETFRQDLAENTGCPRHEEDYLQDDLAMAQKCALRQFGVPLDSWVEA